MAPGALIPQGTETQPDPRAAEHTKVKESVCQRRMQSTVRGHHTLMIYHNPGDFHMNLFLNSTGLENSGNNLPTVSHDLRVIHIYL